METKEKVLAAMKEAGEPLNAGKIAELTGIDRKEVDKAMKVLKEEGAIVINTTKTPEEVRPLLKGYNGKVCTIDAKTISIETLGKYFPNTPMLAAIVKVSKVMTDEELLNDMKGSFKHKFAKKPEVIEGNMKALELALQSVEQI